MIQAVGRSCENEVTLHSSKVLVDLERTIELLGYLCE